MNYRSEKYPDGEVGLKDLVKEGVEIAEFVKEKLLKEDCRLLSDLIDSSGEKNKKALFNGVDQEGNGYVWLTEIPSPFQEQTGLYVFAEIGEDGLKVQYVGITRRLYQRLREHGWGKLSNQATFAHLMAKESFTADEQAILKVKTHPQKADLKVKLEARRTEKLNYVRSLRVAVFNIGEEREFDLAFLEMVIAAALTSHWNSFKTH